jgi:Holliday junction resolvase RusA-like endonuclease
MIEFRVYGQPIPQGSMKAFVVRGRPVLTSDNPRTRPWKHTVLLVARDAMHGAPPFTGPVNVNLWFYLSRPKSAPKGRVLPTVKPDLDKLVRAVLDALTAAGVWTDDSQVCNLIASKCYETGTGFPPHADIRVFDSLGPRSSVSS